LLPTPACTGATPGAGRQGPAQPGKLHVTDLNPAATAGRQAALLETQAATGAVEASIDKLGRALEQQVPERGHGGESFMEWAGPRITARP